MNKVTDPALLAELNKKVTDPELIAELEGAPARPKMPTDTISVFGNNIDVNRNYVGPSLASRLDQQNFGNRALTSFANQAFFDVGGRAADIQMEPATGYGGKFADALGTGTAVGADFALLAPVTALAAGAVPARVTGVIAGGLTKARVPAQLATKLAPGVLRTPATFAAQAQLSGGDPGRAALEGLAFSLLPGAPIVRNLAANPVGAEVVNISALTGMNMAEGMPFGEALGTAVPTAFGLKIGGQVAGPIEQLGPEMRLRRTSAELEKQQMLDERIRMAVEKELLASVATDSKAQEEARRAALMESTPIEPQVLPPSPADIARANAEAEAARLVSANEAALAREAARRAAHDAVVPEMQGGIPGVPMEATDAIARTRALEAEAAAQRAIDETPRQEPGMEPAMENIGTDPVAQNQRTMDRIRAMQAMRDARLQQPQEPVQAPTEAQPQVAVQPELPLAASAPEPIVPEQMPPVRRNLPERKATPSRLAKLTKAEIDAARVRDEIDRGSRDLAVAMGREPAPGSAQVSPVAAPERTPGQSLADRFNNRKPISQALEEIRAREAQRNAEYEQRLADERAKIEERQRERDRQMQAEREASAEGAKERKFRNDPAKMKELARLQAEEQSISDEITKMTDRLDGGEPITQELIDQNSALLARYEAASKAVDEYLSTRGGETPAKPRGDVTLGSGLGGGGEAWKFKELRGAVAEAGKRLGNALSSSDAKISENLLKAYVPGMKESEFLGMPGVRDQLMKVQDIDSVLSTVLEAGNNPQPPKPSGPSGGRGRAPIPVKPAGGTLGSLQQAAEQPRERSRVSAGVHDYLRGNATVPEMGQKLAESGVVAKSERIKQIRQEVRAEIAKAKEEAAANGTKVKQRDLFNGRTAKEEIRYRDLSERLDPQAVEFIEKQRELAAGGEKTSLDITVNRSSTHAQDYLYQGMGGGKVGDANPLDGPLIRNNHDSRRVMYKFNDEYLAKVDEIGNRNGIKLGSKESSAVGPLIEGAGEMPVRDFAATPEGRKILDGLKNEEGVIATAEETIPILEQIRTDRNAVTDALGESPMAKRTGYFPKYEARAEWWRLFGSKGKIAQSYRGHEKTPTVAPSLDAPSKAKKSDPHAKRRTGKEIDRDWDFYRNMHRYIGEESTVVGGVIGLKNAYEYADFLELNGFGPAAEVVRNYAQSDFNKRAWGPMAGIDRYFNEGGVPQVAGDFMKWNYDRLADAVFTLNLGWNLVVQPSSAVFVGASGGIKDSTAGLVGARNREFRQFVDKEVFARQVKSRRGGSIGDVGQEGGGVGGVDTGITKLKHKAQFINEVIEKEVDYFAAYVGMKHGERLGLQGRELTDFMSDYIKKTQDVYNRQDRPELVRSKMFNVMAPFAGFSFNMKSNLQEKGVPIGSRRGAYEINPNKSSKAGHAMRLAIGAAAANAIAGMFVGRDDLYAPSSLPMFDVLTGGGFAKGKLGPAVAAQNELQIWKDAADGKYGEAVARGIRSRVPAGRIISNLILADKYLAGRGPFQLREDEYVKAVILGVWATESGQAYIKTLEKRDPSLAERIMDTGEEDTITTPSGRDRVLPNNAGFRGRTAPSRQMK